MRGRLEDIEPRKASRSTTSGLPSLLMCTRCSVSLVAATVFAGIVCLLFHPNGHAGVKLRLARSFTRSSVRPEQLHIKLLTYSVTVPSCAKRYCASARAQCHGTRSTALGTNLSSSLRPWNAG